MLNKILKGVLVVVLVMSGLNCSSLSQDHSATKPDAVTSKYSVIKSSLAAQSFKIPVGPSDDWEITESWAEHCQKCNDKGYGKLDGFGDFCKLSHALSKAADPEHGCLEYCKYGWDFNLKEDADLGKSVLASGDGVVYKVLKQNFDGSYKSKGWGNTVTIDHGDNVCSRYAHLKNSSITVSEGQQVCQGLKIGEIGGTPEFAPHLHFQFEECDSQIPIAMGFTDGNGIPECIMGDDRYDANGKYIALKRTNVEKQFCAETDYGAVDTGSSCATHKIPNCPLVLGCPNKGNLPFEDMDSMDTQSFNAMSYLWRECAIAGKSDNKFHPQDNLTRAETLKIALSLFGLTGKCVAVESFQDVNPWDWFYPYVLCGIKYGVISTDYSGFNPNDEIHFPEAAKMAVEAAIKAGRAVKKFSDIQHFEAYNVSHWAFQYVETVYAYGGIDEDLLANGPSDNITRAEFARMIASLSPCFCADSTCPDGCECKQKSYTCESVAGNGNPEDQPAVGAYNGGNADVHSFSASSEKDAGSNSGGCGGSGSGSEGMISDAYLCKPNCAKKNCGSDGCGGSCGTCSSEKFCDAEDKCSYKCIAGDCKAQGHECGFVPFTQPGCEGDSHFCGECSTGKICSNNKCVDPPVCKPACYNKNCGPDGCGGSCGTCADIMYCNDTDSMCHYKCLAGDCKAPGPECGMVQFPQPGCEGAKYWCKDCPEGKICTKNKCVEKKPAENYAIGIFCPGGKWEDLTSPNGSYSSGNFSPDNNSSYVLTFKSSELPAYLLIHPAGAGIHVWLEDMTLPPFDVWTSYMGTLTMNPTIKKNLTTLGLTTQMPGDVMLRIPAL